jgi:hypothetical protein
MKTVYISLISGLILGAASWAVVPLVSNKFEPFDSDLALYIGQTLLSLCALYLGYRHGLKYVFIFVFGIYLISNIYPCLFGSSESRAWAVLGLITTLTLCLIPLVSGIIGKLSKIGKTKYNNRLNQHVTKPGTE